MHARLRPAVAMMGAIGLWLAPVSANALSQNTVYTRGIAGASHCQFQFEYGNYLTVAYAKVRMNNAGCQGGTAIETGYLNGAFDVHDASTPLNVSPSNWAQATGTQWFPILGAEIYVGAQDGHVRCININAVNGAVVRDITILNADCPPL